MNQNRVPSPVATAPEPFSAIKTPASEVILTAAGTVTHHYALGRDHCQWYDQQRTALCARVPNAARNALDPHRILNPGVLLDP